MTVLLLAVMAVLWWPCCSYHVDHNHAWEIETMTLLLHLCSPWWPRDLALLVLATSKFLVGPTGPRILAVIAMSGLLWCSQRVLLVLVFSPCSYRVDLDHNGEIETMTLLLPLCSPWCPRDLALLVLTTSNFLCWSCWSSYHCRDGLLVLTMLLLAVMGNS